jgi:hypothetical protein
MWGWKTIETRTHDRFRCLDGETIAIHAAKRFDKAAYDLAGDHLADWQFARCFIESDGGFPRGVVLGTAKVECVGKCVPTDAPFALIECRTPRFGLYLRDIREFVSPIPCIGKQGIFQVQL